MTTRRKILLGGLGALTPVVLNLLAVDLQTTLRDVTPLVIVGYGLRILVLFYVGGIFAFLHRDERQPLKLFELGIVAPALLTTVINTSHADSTSKPDVAAENNRPQVISLFVPVVFAQSEQRTQTGPRDVNTFKLPPESGASQLWRGLTGAKVSKVWFVIANSGLSLDDARREAERIRREQGDFEAEIFAPYYESQGYSVVIGSRLSLSEANALVRKAADAGFKPTLWTFPQK